MELQELLKKVRKIEIKSRKIVNSLFMGEYHSAFKGRGLEFSEVREYQYGDDIRLIDWNVSSRMTETFVKVNHEERELTVMLILDISNSMRYSTSSQTKKELLAELAAVLAFSAISNNDKVGMVMVADSVVHFVKPLKGKRHVLRIIRDILDQDYNACSTTNIGTALEFMNQIQRKKAIIFTISDFYSKDFATPLRILSKRHDIIPIIIKDRSEDQFLDLKWVATKGLESGKTEIFNSQQSSWKAAHSKRSNKRENSREALFRENNCRQLTIHTGEDYTKSLMNYFRSRSK
jgi:uncharacterized protein (DUF58 family)